MRRSILIRFDDLCPTMDHHQWIKAKQLLKQYDVKPLLGIIPECRDPEMLIDEEDPYFWEEMKSLQEEGYTLAMHGCFHSCVHEGQSLVAGRGYSEFAGRPYKEQYETIRTGKLLLKRHGINTDIFFAPRHSYDLNTLKALAANGFKYISDGKSKTVWKREGILCVPCRSSGCPAIRGWGYFTAVFHPSEWSREDKAFGYDELKHLLEKHHSHVVEFKTFSSRKEGNPLIQLISEKLFMIWQDNIRSKLVSIIRRKGR